MLYLPKKRAIKFIRLSVECLSDVYGGGGDFSAPYAYESERLWLKELETDMGGEVLQAGDHAVSEAFLHPHIRADLFAV